MQKFGIACDHAGYEMKEFLVGYLGSKGYDVVDYGCYSPESMDYPDTAHALGNAIDSGEVALGLALCGSGEGISMTLNKHQSVRAALCWNSEVAALTKQHNNANVLTLPARFIDNDQALEIFTAWNEAEFEGGRHEGRVSKIALK